MRHNDNRSHGQQRGGQYGGGQYGGQNDRDMRRGEMGRDRNFRDDDFAEYARDRDRDYGGMRGEGWGDQQRDFGNESDYRDRGYGRPGWTSGNQDTFGTDYGRGRFSRRDMHPRESSLGRQSIHSGMGYGGREYDTGFGGYGGSGYMRNEASQFRGPKGYKRTDERIREEVCERITHLSNQGMLDAGEVEVSVRDGEVTLTGTVTQRHWKHAIEDTTESVSGVRDIDNQIRVKRERETEARGQGTGALLGGASAQSGANVRTENGNRNQPSQKQ